ncbi:MAG: hypothetical protein SGILL_001388 [Bacillariaceae sp.]
MSDEAAAPKGKKEKDSIKIIQALPLPEQAPPPNMPTERDIVFYEEAHPATTLLHDLIRVHFHLDQKQQEGATKNGGISVEAGSEEELAARLMTMFLNGRKFELSGLKDVPKPFLKGQGRFFEKNADGTTFKRLDDATAKARLVALIADEFKKLGEEPQSSSVKEAVDTVLGAKQAARGEGEEPHSAPRPCDVLFLSTESPWEENMAYEHQSGNKHMLYVASHTVSSDTARSHERADAAWKLISAKFDHHNGTEIIPKDPRFVIQQHSQDDSQNSWDEMAVEDLIEFAAVFVFEIYLEKQIHRLGSLLTSAAMTGLALEQVLPSETPIDAPTTHDVLFGRGGMTNGHAGNRRFRDVISLHRPDYIKATKMDKPNVARRIVKAIRHGNPPGRFLKKSEDGMWRDVGDKVASEKTSQGLRERSNAEKRQRSALREQLRIRKEDIADGEGGEPASKKSKADGGVALSIAEGGLDISGVIPLSLSIKSVGGKKKGKKGSKEETDSSGLPPNAVDEQGNILVTDHDILCGRGGLTNHHQGNKRFRDVVALHRPDYVRAPKVQKPSVARVIVRAIRNGDPPGRFLRKDEKTGKWIDIGDKKAAEKTSQALREKTTDEKGGAPAGFTSPTLILPGATLDTPAGKATTEDEDTKPAAAKTEELPAEGVNI